MKARALLAVAAVIIGGIVAASPAHASCGWVKHVRTVNGLIQVHFSYSCSGAEQTGGSESVTYTPPRDSDWDAICVRTAISTGQAPGPYCDIPVEANVAPTVTPGLVGRAFRNLRLPASVLVVQPPGGRTLVNFETNFYTVNGEFTRTVNLLGQRVVLRIWPAGYGWRFGDGASSRTVGAGSPYPDLEITHRYLSTGHVAPRVDTTYAARFRVNGGPWREIAGTVTIPGGARGLRVVEARPVLVGY